MTCWQPWSKPGDPDAEPLESYERDDWRPVDVDDDDYPRDEQ